VFLYNTHNSIKLRILSQGTTFGDACSANGTLALAFVQTLLDAGFAESMTALRIHIRICASMNTDRTFKLICQQIAKNLESKIPLS
jgi:hypothetical protein